MRNSVLLKSFSFRNLDGATYISCFWRVRFKVNYITMYPSVMPARELDHYHCMFDVKKNLFTEFQAKENGDDIPQDQLDHFKLSIADTVADFAFQLSKHCGVDM